MRFQVPQYIDVEDKIGALTFKQYIYVGGSIGLSVVIYVFVPFIILKALLIVPLVAFGLALAFYKHNNRPFIFLVESFFYYLLGDKLYIWKKTKKKQKTLTERAEESAPKTIEVPKVTQGNLHNLALKLDMEENEDRIQDRL